MGWVVVVLEGLLKKLEGSVSGGVCASGGWSNGGRGWMGHGGRGRWPEHAAVYRNDDGRLRAAVEMI